MRVPWPKLGLSALLLVAVPCAVASAAPRPADVPSEGPSSRGLPVSTLDADLERVAERLLRGAKPVEGAIVALDPRSGRILTFRAITSGAPSFDVLTRARLPAASLFKVVTTAALFESTALNLQDRVCINGGAHGIERRHLEPARGPGSDCGRFAWALGNSKNAVFAQLATRLLTRDDLLKTAERLGFNQPLLLDGAAQDAELGKLTVPYGDLDFARAAAGFQGSSLSPLGAAYLMTLIARGGTTVALRLHETANDAGPADSERPALSARTARLLTRMLEVTVETGTSRGAFTAPDGKRYLPGIRVAGKTGTLRPGQGQDSMTSWFTGFAPSRNPEIVVSVMLVNGHTYRRKSNELSYVYSNVREKYRGFSSTVSDPFDTGAADVLAAGTSE